MKKHVLFYTKALGSFIGERERENGRLCLYMFELYNSKHCAYIQFE